MRIWSPAWRKNCAKRGRRSSMKIKHMMCIFGRWWALALLTLLSVSVLAKDDTDICGQDSIKQAFSQYSVKMYDRKIVDIQIKLNSWFDKFGHVTSIGIDGLLGDDTKNALQQFCRLQCMTEQPEDLEGTIVELLTGMKAPGCDKKTPPDPPLPEPHTKDRPGTVVVYRLSEQDLSELKARDAVLQQLQTLKDKEYLSEQALKNAVQENLADLTRLADRYAATVLETSQSLPQPCYRLTEQSFNRLRRANVPEAVLEPIQKLQDLTFCNTDKMEEVIKSRLTEAAEQATNVPFPAQTKSEKKEVPSDPEPSSSLKDLNWIINQAQEVTQQAQEITQQAQEITQWAQEITQEAEEVTVYQLTDESFNRLSNKPEFQEIPAVLLDMISKLQDVEYIDRKQFDQAITGTFEIHIRHFLGMVVEEVGEDRIISQQNLDNLKAKGVPDYILKITTETDKSDPEQIALKTDVQEALSKLKDDFKKNKYFNILADQARRTPSEKLGSIPIRWDGGSCGCSPELSDKIVYGFYPFWLADQVEVAEGEDPSDAKQALDFSALTRIGYYGVYLDKNGNVTHSRHWTGGKNAVGFVEQAWKYKTNLDLVVYTDAWHTWSDDANTINNAAKAVAGKLNLQLPSTGVEQLKSLLPFSEKAQTTMGDGVTIYFQDYTNPDHAGARNKIARFITQLHQELQINPKSVQLNIMINLNWNELDKEGSLFKELSVNSELLGITKKSSDLPELLDSQETGKGYIDLILVLLEEPTTDTKKKLRGRIENEFKGVDRKIVLRKIIPIISPTIHDSDETSPDLDPKNKYAQFKDDLIYFEDNFAGVGLWPLPLAQYADVKAVNQRILNFFKPDVEQDFMERMVEIYIPQLCNYACPNRWQFRILFDILAFVLILVAILALSNCRLSERIKNYPWPVMALLAAIMLVFGISLVCDPYWNQRSDDVAIALLGVIFLIWLWRYIRKLNQGKLP